MPQFTKDLLVVVVLLLAFIVGILASSEAPKEHHNAGSTALCEIDGRFHPDEQNAWEFWMGPYEYFPCKLLPLEGNA